MSDGNRSSAGVLDAGGELLALLGQPAGVDGAAVAGVVCAMDPRADEGEVPAVRPLSPDR